MRASNTNLRQHSGTTSWPWARHLGQSFWHTEAEPDLVLVALDAHNAFCPADRGACLKTLGELAPELLPCADLFSSRLSRYFFWDNTGRCRQLTSTSGVD